MQVQATQPETQARTSRFPSKSELIRRVMRDFQLYHEFEFEQSEAENEEMEFGSPRSLFQSGRAFLMKIIWYGVYKSQLDHGDSTPTPKEATLLGESSLKFGELVPPPNWDKITSKVGNNFIFKASLDLPDNRNFLASDEKEEIAPAAKPRSSLRLLQTSTAIGSPNVSRVDNILITDRSGMMIECCVKAPKAQFEKMLRHHRKPQFFFGCYNSMAVKKKIYDIMLECEGHFEQNKLFIAVADFLSGTLPEKPAPKPLPAFVFEQTKGLNPSQMKSILGYFNCDHFYLTQGPPGTGKSQVFSKFLELSHQMKYRVLVCSMSHAAVDNVLLRFVRSDYYQRWIKSNPGPSFLARFGVEEFMDPASREFGKDFHFESPGSEEYQKKLNMFKNHSMFFATLTGSFVNYIQQLIKGSQAFDYILVDEAAMCVDPFIFMAMTLGKKLILAGDHHQLKPIIKSDEVFKQTTLGKSLFQKIFECEQLLKPEHPVSNCLTIQYRMAGPIASASSDYFYGGKVQTAPAITGNTLQDLGVSPGHYIPNNTSIVWVDHSGLDIEGSKNSTEAEIITKLLKDLVINMKVQPKKIGIISAYKAQISLIKEAITEEGLNFLDNQLLIGSIDAFHGGERDVIIIATTRSNYGGHIGFLSQEERINVAVTRAKRLCIFVGSKSTLVRSETSFFAKLYEQYNKGGIVITYDSFHKQLPKLQKEATLDFSSLDSSDFPSLHDCS